MGMLLHHRRMQQRAQEAASAAPADPPTGIEDKPLSKWKKAELETYAEELEVDISEAKNNGERVQLIQDYLNKALDGNGGNSDEETEDDEKNSDEAGDED